MSENGTGPNTHLGLEADGGESVGAPFAYYVRIDQYHFHSTVHSQGAWQPHEQHMAPAAGLLFHAIHANHPREDLQLSQITFEILGVIHGGLLEVTTEVIRPGKTIELIQATMSHNGRAAIRAFAWRLITSDTSDVAGTDVQPLPPVQGSPERTDMPDIWPGGFIRSLHFREAIPYQPGSGAAWMHTDVPLVLDEPSHPVATFLGLVDAANGVAVRKNPKDYLFPNVDLSIHLFREPQPGWTGLKTLVSWGPSGLGLTASELHDEHGAVGRVAQSLTVRKLNP